MTVNLFLRQLLEKSKMTGNNKPWVPALWLLTVLTALLAVTVVVDLFYGISVYFFITLAVKGVYIYFNLRFLRRFFLNEDNSLYRKFKTYIGYSFVFIYVASNLPRMVYEERHGGPNTASFVHWCLSFVLTLLPVLIFFLMWRKRNQLAWGIITKAEYKSRKVYKENQKNRKRTRAEKIWENVDAFVYSIIAVIILQHFVFQLYRIPSESMVPTFLIKDRPITVKVLSGPNLPLTDWHLPTIKDPSRGDVIVIKNPRYAEPSVAKRILKQFIFYLTLSFVNIDMYDEYGNMKSDPLVKRVIGIPGDKVMMVDDQVYIRREGGTGFIPLAVDRERYSQTKLYNLSYDICARVQRFPIEVEETAALEKWDAVKNAVDIGTKTEAVAKAAEALAAGIAALPQSRLREMKTTWESSIPTLASQIESLKSYHSRNSIRLFQDIYRMVQYDMVFFYIILTDNDELKRFTELMNLDGSAEPVNLFDESARRLNLIFKEWTVKRMTLIFDLWEPGITFNRIIENDRMKTQSAEMTELLKYLLEFYDFRNMPEFPAGDGNYIPDGYYLPIGDNRYNSIDFRYKDMISRYRYLDGLDPYSTVYLSNLDPFLLPQRNIMAYAVGRLFPFNRIGLVGK